jgi:hypothetical protein
MHYAASRKVEGSISDVVIGFFNCPNPFNCTVTLGSTQPLIEMRIRNLPGGKGWPAREADNLTAICEPTVWKIWDPGRLTTLWISRACYRDNVTLSLSS